MAAAAGSPDISRTRRDSFSILQHNPARDSATAVRDALLVVAALVVAATFQAAVNPPGGVWQDTLVVNGTISRYAGKAIIASDRGSYLVFICFNTVAFSSSAVIIGYLVYGFPFFLETWTALFAMSMTYSASVAAVRPPGTNTEIYFIFALLLPYFVSYPPRLLKSFREPIAGWPLSRQE